MLHDDFIAKIWRGIGIFTSLGLAMAMTRGSHVVTSVMLPDASLAVFLLGGLWLRHVGWFVAMFALSAAIDYAAASVDPALRYGLTYAYWGMLPTYGLMWISGWWLGKQHTPFGFVPFAGTFLLASFFAFVISTQSYYLLSGYNHHNDDLTNTIQYGWQYLPQWMGNTLLYGVLIWLLSKLAQQRVPQPVKQPF